VNTANWYASDQVALPIGQVDAVPPIQILDAYNAIANGGVFVEPKLVRGYVYANGAVRPRRRARSVWQSVRACQATMVKMLEQVVLSGTGTNAIIPGYSVARQKPAPHYAYPGRTNSWSGITTPASWDSPPRNNPVLSMIVVVERPESTIFGWRRGRTNLPRGHVLRIAPLQHSFERHVPEAAQGRRCLDLLGRDLMQLATSWMISASTWRRGLEITHVDIDSRDCVPGSLFFFALPGSSTNGVNFAADAVRRGALCVVASTRVDVAARSWLCRRRN